MSVRGAQRRYVSTLRIQLSVPACGGGRRQPTRPLHNLTASRKTGEGTPDSVAEGNGLLGIRNPPLFLEPLQDCLVDEGNDFTLRAVITGSQPISVSWLHNEVPVKRRSSSGTVFCSFVCLVPPMKIVDPPDLVEVRAGGCARLSCVFKGSIPIVSCWTHNKKEVFEDSRLSIESSSKGSSLVISEAQPEDSGFYTLTARDRNSFAHHTLTLSVIERPQPPSSCPVVCVLSPDSVVLSWSGPCYDGGSALTGYLVEVLSLGPDQTGHWSELSANCKSTSLRVRSGLQPQGQYRFRVRACNAVGVSEPSEESQPIKMDAPGEVSATLTSTDSPPTLGFVTCTDILSVDCAEVLSMYSFKAELQDEMTEYVNVTIDDKHKVTDHYNVLERLGTGRFGQVFRLTHKVTGHVCAGKFYKGRRTSEREAAKKEITLMNFLHHPKLVQCLAAYNNKPEIVMVMEFIAGGELFERIVDDNFEHTEPTSVGYMCQILQGIEFMHKQSIVHLDLKPENIVCVNRTGTQVKIIDFGLASKLDASSPLRVMYGTPEFVAPEVISYEPVGPATDMWSIGVICYILLSGESPFQGGSDSETLALVTAAEWEFVDESFEDITEQAKDFISSLLHKDTRRRMSCEEALFHSWMVAFKSEQPNTAKNLSKEKMKKFLARQKWKKTGKAMLALKRMSMLTKADNSASLPSSAHEHALKSLEKKMQLKPEFTKSPFDLSVFEDSTAQFFCQIAGYPDPEVVWSREGEPLEESEGSVKIEYEEDGTCVLTLENTSLQHSGTYSCRATNIHGEALCSAKLTVVDQEDAMMS
ncbi:hypothetical protein P4O66_007584 [Electrophorus voltai]|uniref:Myosin, light chain kinase 5 n=1 Tax=Electrophorus voltai TaxID=2609070 RepID=A0AAD8ZKX2_9TELE|nr:hypothetical protein P4O66_007584 [Electrophorus voltai]